MRGLFRQAKSANQEMLRIDQGDDSIQTEQIAKLTQAMK